MILAIINLTILKKVEESHTFLYQARWGVKALCSTCLLAHVIKQQREKPSHGATKETA